MCIRDSINAEYMGKLKWLKLDISRNMIEDSAIELLVATLESLETLHHITIYLRENKLSESYKKRLNSVLSDLRYRRVVEIKSQMCCYVSFQQSFLLRGVEIKAQFLHSLHTCLLYTSPSPRDQA
eukprot:TRINITY_DN15357_c0_g1_i1.p1 TRINITY_DN15357_c0_g1~~TRINITY_DN15357_c0_g1_i1.p1  ORF type:complete len:125 (+),score=10.75 TRINITY_DN15357_c0_g1_i1:64-438(+)